MGTFNFFYRGPYSSYDISIHGEGIYFATDRGIIKMGGKDYIGPLGNSTAVKSISLNNDGSKFVITYLNGTSTEIEMAKSEYESNISDKSLKMPNAVGGIAKNTKISDLEGKTYNEMFDDLLFPSVNPTKTNPSVSGFELGDAASPVLLGTDVVGISEAGLNKGKWNEYNNNLAYTGDIANINYEFKINGETIHDIDGTIPSLPEKFTTLGNHTYKTTVEYGQGPIPKNNKGIEVPSLRASAGSVTATRTINVTLPWYYYINANLEVESVGDNLLSWNTTTGAMSTGEFVVRPHSASHPQIFTIPRVATSMQMYNTVAGKFETVAIVPDWKEEEYERTINGITHTFYRYTYTGEARGSVTLIVNF